MVYQIEQRQDMRQLRRLAKELLKAHRSGDTFACATLRLLRRFRLCSDAAILASPLALHDAQYAFAMSRGFASWDAMVRNAPSAPLSDGGSRLLRVTLVSHDVRCGEAEWALRLIADSVGPREDGQPRLFVFPELGITGFPKTRSEADCAAIAEPVPDGPSIARVVELAVERNVFICAGLVEHDRGLYYYTHVLCGPDGYIGRQRKLFPARGLTEDGAVSGGERVEYLDLLGYRCVILACADWMMPESSYLAAMCDASIVLAPTDGFRVSETDRVRSLAFARSDETRAPVVIVGGGESRLGGEFIAGVVADNGIRLYGTRMSGEVKRTTLDVELRIPSLRWGGPHDRVHRLVRNLA